MHLTLEAVHASTSQEDESDATSAANHPVIDNTRRSLGAIQAFRWMLPRTDDKSPCQPPAKTATCEVVTASSDECCICLDPLNSKDKDGFESAQKVACGIHSIPGVCYNLLDASGLIRTTLTWAVVHSAGRRLSPVALLPLEFCLFPCFQFVCTKRSPPALRLVACRDDRRVSSTHHCIYCSKFNSVCL
jgi:hypothetical protein